jgi:hypothetical protein
MSILDEKFLVGPENSTFIVEDLRAGITENAVKEENKRRLGRVRGPFRDFDLAGDRQGMDNSMILYSESGK